MNYFESQKTKWFINHLKYPQKRNNNEYNCVQKLFYDFYYMLDKHRYNCQFNPQYQGILLEDVCFYSLENVDLNTALTVESDTDFVKFEMFKTICVPIPDKDTLKVTKQDKKAKQFIKEFRKDHTQIQLKKGLYIIKYSDATKCRIHAIWCSEQDHNSYTQFPIPHIRSTRLSRPVMNAGVFNSEKNKLYDVTNFISQLAGSDHCFSVTTRYPLTFSLLGVILRLHIETNESNLVAIIN